jgi:SAM-dependent methyltransferase
MNDMKNVKNMDLLKKYNAVYDEGSSGFFTTNGFAESKLLLDLIPNWNGLNVLEIGCGEGNLAAMLSFAGAKKVDAIDYSIEAINIAKRRIIIENVSYTCMGYQDVTGTYDVVALQGVLEHLDNSFEALTQIIETNLNDNGKVILTTPSFLNPRGYIWMTLQLLFNVPMSLTDLNFMCPFDFVEFCSQNGYILETIKSTEQDWGAGDLAIVDLKERLTNALRDAGMDNSNVDKLLAWLQKAVRYHHRDELSGAIVGYMISKKK